MGRLEEGLKPRDMEELDLCHNVDRFAIAMKEKLIRKAREGFRGWNHGHNKIRLRQHFKDHLYRYLTGDDARPIMLIDIANFAFFLWYHSKDDES